MSTNPIKPANLNHGAPRKTSFGKLFVHQVLRGEGWLKPYLAKEIPSVIVVQGNRVVRMTLNMVEEILHGKDSSL
jgi:hypothetical protein